MSSAAGREGKEEAECLAELEKRWAQACKLVLGGEIGEMKRYEGWLSVLPDRVYTAKSAISGKEVAFSTNDYPKTARKISFDEADFLGKPAPLDIDDIKDIDSLINAVRERVSYCGNVVLGNSSHVVGSTNITDSHYIYRTSRSGDSKYLAYCSMARLSESCFGVASPGESQHLIVGNSTYRAKRGLELWMAANTSDSYYVFYTNNCSDCIFCFNAKNLRHAIGNIVLGKEKYATVKSALLSQFRDELEAKKKLPSLLEIIGDAKPDYAPAKTAIAGLKAPAEEEKTTVPMEEAYARTCELLFGKRMGKLGEGKKWLQERILKGKEEKSALSGKPVFVGDYAKYGEVPPCRIVAIEEADALSVKLAPAFPPEKLTLQNAGQFVKDIAYMAFDITDGVNKNVINAMEYAYSVNCLNCFPAVRTKNSAYDFWTRTAEDVFGCGVLFDSQFCIHCYQSAKLSRCFECDACRECTGLCFCHNCENVHDSMFCFNAKNLKYAVGNAEVGRVKYLEVRKMVVDELLKRLETQGTFGFDICNLGQK